jgi:hypothetical protein
MKQYLCCLLLLFVSINAFCQKNIQSELDELNKTMGKSALYDQRKDQIISRLQQNLDPSTPLKLFEGYRGLYEEYKVFNYDSAYSYTQKLFRIALQTHNDSLFNYVKIKQSFVLLSSGMFKEAFDSLNTIHYRKFDKKRTGRIFYLTGPMLL